MKLICLSDTHNQHDSITVPDGDVLIHAGDATMTDNRKEVTDFLHWFAAQPHKHKLLVWGNHSLSMDNQSVYDAWAKPRGRGYRDTNKIKQECQDIINQSGIIVLNNSGVTIEGINFYGSPVTPWFGGWGFNVQRGYDIQRYWNMIPDNTHVLVSHGPAKDILDYIPRSHQFVGCANLAATIFSRLHNLKFHIFGHIHESYGMKTIEGKTFINASMLNDDYKYTGREPISVIIKEV